MLGWKNPAKAGARAKRTHLPVSFCYLFNLKKKKKKVAPDKSLQ